MAKKSLEAHSPQPETILFGLYAEGKGRPAFSFKGKSKFARMEIPKLKRDNDGKLNMRLAVREALIEETKKDESVIDVYNIKGSFGSSEFKIDVYIYDSKEDLEKNLRKKKSSGEKAEEKEEKPEKNSGEGSAPVEDKAEQVEEKQEISSDKSESATEKPIESPVEDKSEKEAKAVEEQKQGEEESKE